MSRIVVLGTGTDVGKTYVTVHLAQTLALHSATASVSALKPIESGITRSQLPAQNNTANRPLLLLDSGSTLSEHSDTDAALLAEASSPPFQTAIHAYAFPDPISPHLAAHRANATIDVTSVANWVKHVEQTRRTLQYVTLYDTPDATTGDRRSWTLIETAGAAFSPLTKGVTNLDLATQLGPAIWILVAPDRLGVLHDLTVTLCAFRHFGRLPDSIVLCQSANPDPSTGTNARELRDLEIAKIDVTVERGASIPGRYIDRLVQLAEARRL